MNKAKYYKTIDQNKVLCELCPNYCLLEKGDLSSCNARKNINGELISLTYGNICAANIDPIEKKPLYHFLPGTNSLSVGTAACNLHCKNCQNHHISQISPMEATNINLSTEKLISHATKSKSKSISYTYNEPTVFIEYLTEIAEISKQNNMKNIAVSNGYINSIPLFDMLHYINAVNIDLKAFSNSAYNKLFNAKLNPVLESIKEIYKNKVWLEITMLIIPENTDDLDTIKKMCEWIIANTSENTPVHFSRFFPTYKMSNLSPTNLETIEKACNIAKECGLRYVYAGNTGSKNDTVCPNCKEVLISRENYKIMFNKISPDSNCFKCNTKIAGVWE